MIKFVDPRGEVRTEEQPYELSFDLQNAPAGTTVGLLANGFPDSQNFLEILGATICRRWPHLQVKVWNKGNASIAAPQSMLDEIKAQCQVVVAAWGH